MKTETEVGERGFLAYLNAYVIEVEFLGFSPYEPEYPSQPTRYYRALEKAKCGTLYDVQPGHIIDEDGPHDEVLFKTRDEAMEVVRADAAYWLKRKEEELAELRKRSEL